MRASSSASSEAGPPRGAVARIRRAIVGAVRRRRVALPRGAPAFSAWSWAVADTLDRVSGALGWLRARLGVRVVTSLAAAFSVAVVLLLAGAALVLLTDRLLRSSLEDTAKQQAEVVAQRVAANFEDDVKQNAVDATAERGDLVQVVRDYGDDGDHDIEVLGASNPLWTMKPMASVLPGPGDTEVVRKAWVTHRDGIRQTDPETTEEVMVVAYGTSVKGRDLVVYAAQPLENVHEAVDTVFHLALIGIPLLVLITGIVTYLAAGRALRPVEAIRARVATTRDPSVRVPVPPARDEVGRLAETMNEMLARLQAGQAVQRRFVADASHELRSPLATIATGLELLARGERRPRHGHRPARGDRAAGSAGRRAAAARPRRRERPAAAVRGRRPRRGGRGGAAAAGGPDRPPDRGRARAGRRRPGAARPGRAQPRRQRLPARPLDGGVSVRPLGSGTRRWTSRTTGRACRPTSGRACSSGSSVSTTPARARTAVRGWGSRSSRRSSRRTAARWTSSAARSGGALVPGAAPAAGGAARAGTWRCRASSSRPSPLPRPSTV